MSKKEVVRPRGKYTQSTLGYISPMRFEANWHAGQLKQAA
jgi:hypothetical protein